MRLAQKIYDYFIMFHDDDEMLPNMVQILYESMKADSSIVAVGCNACLNIYGRLTAKKINNIKKHRYTILFLTISNHPPI